MKRILLLTTVGLLIVASMASAAEVRTAKGTNALLFSLSGLDNLGVGTFDGGIGFRHYMQDGTAIRPAVNFLITTFDDPSDVTTTTTGLGATLALEKHMAAVGPVSPYVGLGAGLQYSKVEQDATPTDYESRATTVFGFIPVGFEWAFADGITLGGEYQFRFSHTNITTEDPNVNMGAEQESSVNQFGILSNNAAQLTISVAWK